MQNILKHTALKCISVLMIMLMPANCYAKHQYKESVYQEYWCNNRGGVLEYELNDKSRVDCLLPDMAVEFDFAKKRDECLGQALRYSAYTEKTPACVLILENGKDYKYYYQLKYTIDKNNMNVRLFTITPSDLIFSGF